MVWPPQGGRVGSLQGVYLKYGSDSPVGAGAKIRPGIQEGGCREKKNMSWAEAN